MEPIHKDEQKNTSLWNYEVIQAFNELHYRGLLTKKDLVGNKEIVVKEATRFKEESQGNERVVIEEPIALNNYFFVLQKNTDRYLLQSDQVNKLPIQVRECEKIAYNKEGYWLIKKFAPVGFAPQRLMSFRQIVDNFAFFNHNNSPHFKLWKIIALTAYLSRINVRVATEPAFGKDSIFRLIDDLMEHVGIVQKPTLAKLEYLTNNKVILVNEFVNLSPQETREIEQYLLTTGDFSNKYQKRSRASSSYGGTEEYDTSKLSVILTYNNLDCYPEDIKYFDVAHTKQIKERFLPFKFSGRLEHVFSRESTPSELAEKHRDFYVSIARSIKYFADANNVKRELKPFPTLDLVNEFRDRWRINFETILRFINLYSNDEKEYKKLAALLFNAHIDYIEMVDSKGNKSLLSQFHSKISDDGFEESPDITLIEERIE